MMEKKYLNNEIAIHWKPELCIHSGICARGLSEVFMPAKRPWINPEGASTEKIIEQVKKCPSGALSYAYLNDEIPKESSLPAVKVSFMDNGPVLIKGACVVQMPDGSEIKKEKGTSLCRCKQSGNFPFCDGTHKRLA